MSFDFAPYRFTIDPTQNPPWHMDERHIGMLFDAINQYRDEFNGVTAFLKAQGISRDTEVTAIEIGSHRGASTAAFVEALNAGLIDELTCIEPHPTAELHRVLGMVQKGKARVIPKTSQECSLSADFVFIDGDHGWPAIHEVARCLAIGVPVIAIHDTRGFYGCGGSALAAAVLRESVGREFTEDFETRPGEWTHRGFLVSRKI